MAHVPTRTYSMFRGLTNKLLYTLRTTDIPNFRAADDDDDGMRKMNITALLMGLPLTHIERRKKKNKKQCVNLNI